MELRLVAVTVAAVGGVVAGLTLAGPADAGQPPATTVTVRVPDGPAPRVVAPLVAWSDRVVAFEDGSWVNTLTGASGCWTGHLCDEGLESGSAR